MSVPERNVSGRHVPLLAVLAVVSAVFAGAVYANLQLLVRNPGHHRFFPPFRAGHHGNTNALLGAEYFNIAQAMASGHGFASPFGVPSGPTAWMPPVLPTILTGLLWLCGGDHAAVMAIVVFLQVLVLIATGLLVLRLTREARHVGPRCAAAIFTIALVLEFRLCFQVTHDGWLVLLTMDASIAALCWCRPLGRWEAAAGWGLFGGFCAMVNPIVALAWGVCTLALAWHERQGRRAGIALLAAVLALTPWTVRNYLVFGRFIPVKSNLIYELYQSQCIQPDGLIQRTTFASHPYARESRERPEYVQLGEMAFLDSKGKLFWDSVRNDPLDFVVRVGHRFRGTTLWYQPFDREVEATRPWLLGAIRLLYPLPFLAMLGLLATSLGQPLPRQVWVVMAMYVLYLSPYIAFSYYYRYAMPLLGVKVLLVAWGTDRLVERYAGSRAGRHFGRDTRTSAGSLPEQSLPRSVGPTP